MWKDVNEQICKTGVRERSLLRSWLIKAWTDSVNIYLCQSIGPCVLFMYLCYIKPEY